MKKLMILLLVLLIPCGAFAEVFEGVTEAMFQTALLSDGSGTVRELEIKAGDRAEGGDVYAVLASTPVFATENGTVASVKGTDGTYLQGTAVEITPHRKYLVYCTSSEAHETPANQVIHMGETVWMKCIEDGTHLAAAIVTKLEGSEYQVQTIGGELYVGETVWLYRSSAMKTADCVGKGTVVGAESLSYSCQGYIGRMAVQPGDFVERGQLLFTYTAEKDSTLTIPANGIITQLNIGRGDSVQTGQVLGQMAAYEDILVRVDTDTEKLSCFARGASVELLFADDPDGNRTSGIVTEISAVSDNDTVTVWIRPEETISYIGLSADVFTKE